MLTDDELLAIEERAREADDGPWWLNNDSDEPLKRATPASICADERFRLGNRKMLRTMVLCRPEEGAVIENMRFIAHAREDIPRLVAEIRRLREAIRTFIYHTEGEGDIDQHGNGHVIVSYHDYMRLDRAASA